MAVTQSLVVHLAVTGIGEIIHCRRYSSLNRLLRVTSYVIRFCNNLKAKAMHIDQFKDGEIDAADMEQSKLVWLKYEQTLLKNSENFSKVKASLKLFEDQDKLLRCKTRLENHLHLNFNVANPILLQTFSHFTNLLIVHYHEENFHNGVNSTLIVSDRNFGS